MSAIHQTRHKGRYGIDAPYAPALMGLGLLACIGLIVFARMHGLWITAVLLVVLLACYLHATLRGKFVVWRRLIDGLHLRGDERVLDLHGLWITAVLLVVLLACYLHATLRGKFVVWRRLIDGLHLRGDERVLDLGCGRGALLLMVAQRLPHGRATGIDIWSSRDQSGNAMATTLANAAIEGVADRIELRTADMRELPFPDDSIDVIVSNVAIHNIGEPDGRKRAVVEALRVLRPGGRLLIADIKFARRYAAILQARGAADVTVRSLGWRMWWGSPFVPTTLVAARKPAR